MNRGPGTRRFAFVCPNYFPRTCGVGDFSMRLGQELMRRGHDVALFTWAPAQVNPEAPEVRVFAAEGASPLVIAGRLRPKIDAFVPTDLIIQYTPQMLGAWRWGSPAILRLAVWARRPGINLVLLAHELYLPWDRRPDLALAATSLSTAARCAGEGRKPRSGHDGDARERGGEAGAARWRRSLGGRRANWYGRDPGDEAVETRSPADRDVLHARLDETVRRAARLLQNRPISSARGRACDPRRSGRFGGCQGTGVHLAAHPARERIRQPGKQSLSEIAREVADLDFYLFTMVSGANSRSRTLPLALGTGLPVVAIRGHGTDELFVDGENISFAADLSGQAFADAVLGLDADEQHARGLSEGAVRLYRDHLSWDRIADQFLSQI